MNVRNPFRNPIMRREFDAAVRSYAMRHRDLFLAKARERYRKLRDRLPPMRGYRSDK